MNGDDDTTTKDHQTARTTNPPQPRTYPFLISRAVRGMKIDTNSSHILDRPFRLGVASRR